MFLSIWIVCSILYQSSKVQALDGIRDMTLVPLIKGDRRQIFNYEQTIVVRDLLPNNEVRRCEMIEV